MRKKLMILTLVAMLSNTAFSFDDCSMPESLLNAIAIVESGYVEGGYPYIIGINESEDIPIAKKITKRYTGGWLDNRTFDCKNKENCIYLARKLVRYGITNIDLGRYQINFKWHSNYAQAFEDFFEEKYSKQITCKVVEDCVKQYGYNWYGVSCYHSRTPKYNNRYAKKLAYALEKIQQKEKQNND